MFSMMKHTAVLLALFAGTCLAEPAFMRAETQPGRQLVSCSETCSVTGSCSSGNIAVCHEGKEDECIASSEWNEHCTDFGDTCGACASGGTSCFSGTSTLYVRGKGLVTMEEAQVGDMVLTGENTFEPLFAFGHLDKDSTSRFVKITTARDTLEITGEHLVYLADKAHAVRADSIKVGDELQTAGASSTVEKISSVEKRGLYAPLTPSGKVVVNGVMASSYIALDQGEEYFSTLNGLVQIPHDSWVHFYLTPVRVVCLGITDKPCHVMNDQGIPLYIAWGMDLVDMVHNSTSMMAQSLFLVITALMIVGFVVVEALFGATMGPVMVFSLATAYSFSRKNLAVANKKTVEN